jgi:hypothetical protein
MVLALQKKEENFLDPDLPSDETELTARIKEVGREITDLRRRQETLVVGSPEYLELKTEGESLADLRDRLINQRTNVQAGTKIVSRLTATGRARQLVPDEEHLVSARPTLYGLPSHFGYFSTV